MTAALTTALARAIMTLAVHGLGEHRRDWARAMQAEFEEAAADGKPLSFALGCLAATLRETLARPEGRLTLTSYALVFAVMIPMAALQLGCALFGLPYLYPGTAGLSGALLVGGEHEVLIRGVYQAAVPSLALLLVVLGLGHLRIAWAVLDRDWAGAARLATLALAAAVTLTAFMGILFLDGTQALIQGAVLTIELATVAALASRHDQLSRAAAAEHPG